MIWQYPRNFFVVKLFLATLVLAHDIEGTIFLVGGNGGTTLAGKFGNFQDSGNATSPSQIPDYPLSISNAVGTIFNNQLLVCGGYKYPIEYFKDCYAFSNDTPHWTPKPALNFFRKGAAIVKLDNETIWVTGGEDMSGCIRQTEILKSSSEDGWITGPDLPECLVEHCMLKIDSQTVLITGGKQSSYHSMSSRRTWLYHISNSSFTELTSTYLHDKRIGLACSTIVLEDGNRVVVVVGGRSSDSAPHMTSSTLSKMEVFNLKTRQWTLRNQPLPYLTEHIVWGSSLVHSQDHGLLLVGGITPSGQILDTVFEYNYNYGFRLLTTHLSQGRYGQVTVSTEQSLVKPQNTLNLTSLPDILVVGGRGPHPSSGAEVLSFKVNSGQRSQQKTNFPYDVTGAIGMSTMKGPTICGGLVMSEYDYSKECYIFTKNLSLWTPGPALMDGRYRARVVPISKNVNWVLGGENGEILGSTEILDSSSSQYGPNLPRVISRFCAVMINGTHVLIAGGKEWANELHNEFRSRHVWIGHWQRGDWTEVDPMFVARYDHTCGLFTRRNGKRIIVVAGGKTGSNEASLIRHIEWLDLETLTWTLTNQTILGHPDLGLYGATLTKADSQLILVGGTDSFNFYDNVLIYDEDFGYYDSGKKISTPRRDTALVSLA